MKENRLPHWAQDHATYFLTFRLADSLPESLLSRWKSEREAWLKLHPAPWNPAEEAEYHSLFSSAEERWLDSGFGSCALARPEVRRPVVETIRAPDPHSIIWSLVIMPNHAHVLVSLKAGLGEMMRLWKGRSARLANLARGTSGAFWSKDYFDRLIRDESHFRNCARYIRRNPIKANLSAGEFFLAECGHVRGLLDGAG